MYVKAIITAKITAVTTALTTVQTNAISMIGDVMPAAMTIVGAMLVVKVGIKAFKSVTNHGA